MDYLLEIIGSLLLLILSGLGFQVRSMAQRLDQLEEKKLDKVVYEDLTHRIDKVSDALIDLKVELAKWHGRAEIQDKIRQEKY